MLCQHMGVYMEAYKLLEQIKEDPKSFLAAGKGEDFENRIRVALDRLGYNRIKQTDLDEKAWWFFVDARERKWSKDKIDNLSSYKKHYIYHPSGTQNYPDFAIFDEKHILCIEVKFTKGKLQN